MLSQYILILVWLGFCALMAASTNRVKTTVLLNGVEERRYTWWFAFLVFAPIIWMAGTRTWIADTSAYILSYWDMPDSILGIPAYLATHAKDQGFSVVSIIIKSIVGNDYTIYLMIFAILQGVSLVVFYRKYSIDYVFSVFLFVASTDYFAWMFNGLRQFIAVTIILFATPLMLKQTDQWFLKKYLPLSIVVFLASRIHGSALLMIPLVVLAQGKAWNKKTLLVMAGSMVVILFIDRFVGILDDVLQDTQYENVVTDFTQGGDDGTNALRVLVYSVPAILSFIGRERIRREGDVLINFSANMSILSAMIYVISMFTSGIFIGRLPIYCSLFGYILLPWLIKNIFTKESVKIVYGCAIFFYLVFYYWQMHLSWGII